MVQLGLRSLFGDDAARFVDHADQAIVRIQVNAAIVHDALLPVKAVLANAL